MLGLADEQFEYRGLRFGPGTEYYVDNVSGIAGFEVRTSDSDQPRGDGAIRGIDYVAPRLVSVELALLDLGERNGVDYEAKWAQVRSAFRPSRQEDFPLYFKRPGQPEQLVNCRPVQLVRSEDYLDFNTVGFPPVTLRAVDPRIYSADPRAGNATVYVVNGGGTDLDGIDFPLDFSGGTQTELVVDNAGTADAYPVIRFYGPTVGTCDGVRLTNSTTGQILDISATITTGQILTADMTAAATGADRLVISLDGVSRYGDWAVPRSSFALVPGSNTLRFQVTGTTIDMLANVTWRDTSLD